MIEGGKHELSAVRAHRLCLDNLTLFERPLTLGVVVYPAWESTACQDVSADGAGFTLEKAILRVKAFGPSTLEEYL